MLSYARMTILNATFATNFIIQHSKHVWNIQYIYEKHVNVQITLLLLMMNLPIEMPCFLSWSEVEVDLIGLRKIKVAAQAIEFRALTYIFDKFTNLVEI